MRYTPDDPAFAADFVEFSDSWSRAQVNAAWGAIPTSTVQAADAETKLLDILRPKIIKLHLTCAEGEPITDPADLTVGRMEQVDERLYRWFANVWIAHLIGLQDLGNALGRGLYATSDGSKQATAKKATPARRSRKS